MQGLFVLSSTVMVEKRVAVPPSLHAELTEYTNLIRVLRTTRTLDLTNHLLQYATQRRQQEDSKRDTWTRWPLLDFPVPEWPLDDEIMVLSESVFRQLQDDEDAREVGESSSDITTTNTANLHPSAAHLLVGNIGALLAHILDILADQRPSTTASMQPRLFPMNWEDVIASLAVHGVVDQAVLSSAEKRLQEIYSSSGASNVMRRMSVVAAAKEKYASLTSTYDDILLQPPQPRKKGRRTRRVTSNTSVDYDLEHESE